MTIVVNWLDNEAVHIAFNFAAVAPMVSVKRWCEEAKEKKQISCPQIIKSYNSGMGGVGLANMFLYLYRISVKIQQWYLKIFWHCVDIARLICLAIISPQFQHDENTKEAGTLFNMWSV